MEVSYRGDRHERKLIRDVIDPPLVNGFDVRQSAVKRQSIGVLNQQYLQARHSSEEADQIHQARHVPSATVRAPYTRIPPMQTLYSFVKEPRAWRSLFSKASSRPRHLIARVRTPLLAAWLAIGRFGVAAVHPSDWLSRKYQINRGTYIISNPRRLAKRLSPALLIIVGLVLFAVLLQDSTKGPTSQPKTHQGTASQTAHGTSLQIKNNGKTASKSPSNSTQPTPSGNSQAATNLTNSSLSQSSLSSGSNNPAPTGGMGGGGPSTTTTPTATSSSTLTTPPVSAQVLNKPLVNVSGTTTNVDPTF